MKQLWRPLLKDRKILSSNLEQILRRVFFTILIALCLPLMRLSLAIDTNPSPLMNLLSAYLVPLFTYLLSVLKDWVILVSMTELDLGFGAHPFETMDCEGYNELTSGWKDWLNKSLLSFSASLSLRLLAQSINKLGCPALTFTVIFTCRILLLPFPASEKTILPCIGGFQKWTKNRTQTDTQPQIPDFLAKVDLPQAHPMDTSDTLRQKAAIILESYCEGIHPREQYDWWDVAQTLAQKVSVSDKVTREDLCVLLNQLKNPRSELYLDAVRLMINDKSARRST